MALLFSVELLYILKLNFVSKSSNINTVILLFYQCKAAVFSIHKKIQLDSYDKVKTVCLIHYHVCTQTSTYTLATDRGCI